MLEMCGDEKQADLVLAFRFVGQQCPAGARLDLECCGCHERVVLMPGGVRQAEGGAKPICQECINMAIQMYNDKKGSKQ